MSFAAAGTIALVAGGTKALVGGISAATSGAKKAQKNLEQLAGQSPMYKGNKSIEDYYGEALGRYKESPYQSKQYQEAQKAAGATTAAGLGAMQDRRGALGAVSRLAGIQNQAMANAGVAAEQQRNQRFGQLGGAAQMKTAEDYRKFDINEMTPYQRKLQLAQYKSQSANAKKAAGLQMLGSGLSDIGTAALGSISGGGGGVAKASSGLNIDNTVRTISPERPSLSSVTNKIMSINPNAQPMNIRPATMPYDYSTNRGKNWWEQ
jgi:hypothetical protein